METGAFVLHNQRFARPSQSSPLVLPGSVAADKRFTFFENRQNLDRKLELGKNPFPVETSENMEKPSFGRFLLEYILCQSSMYTSAAFTRQEGGGHVLDISDDPMVDM